MPRKSFVLIAIPVLLMAAAAVSAPQQKKPDAPTGLKIQSLPDLVVVSIDFKDYKTTTRANGTKSASFLPSVTYKNQGTVASGVFELAWEFFNYSTNTWEFWLRTGLTNNLAPGQSFTEGGGLADQFGWEIGSVWPKFRCRLDIKGAVSESNETNNNLEKTFNPLTPGLSPGTPIIKK